MNNTEFNSKLVELFYFNELQFLEIYYHGDVDTYSFRSFDKEIRYLKNELSAR